MRSENMAKNASRYFPLSSPYSVALRARSQLVVTNKTAFKHDQLLTLLARFFTNAAQLPISYRAAWNADAV